MNKRPLDGRTVLVAASVDRTKMLVRALRARGAIPLACPMVRITPPADVGALDQAIREWASYHWVVFTSTHGVDAVLARARALRVNLSRRRGKIAAVGPATKARLEAAGLPVHAMPREFLTDAIPEALGDIHGRRILLPRSRLARPSLAHELRRRGAEVVELVAYDAIPAGSNVEPIRKSPRIDFVAVTSASAVRNLVSALPQDLRERIRKEAETACIGPVTADAARGAGLRVTVVAKDHTLRGLVESLARGSPNG